jgi:hypothetical protein
MRRVFTDPYYRAGFVLVLAAVGLLSVATMTDRRDLTSATLYLCGVASFIAGVFSLTLSSERGPQVGHAALLAPGGTIAVSRICSDLGLSGDAVFIPWGAEGVTQFIPVQETLPSTFVGDNLVVADDSGCAFRVVSSAAPLLEHLTTDHSLAVPGEVARLGEVAREVLVEVLEVADGVDVTITGDSILLNVRGYRLIAGCRVVQAESPKCCTMYPCPVCSLLATLTARCMAAPVQVVRTSVPKRGRDLTLFLTPIKGGVPSPIDVGPGSSV